MIISILKKIISKIKFLYASLFSSKPNNLRWHEIGDCKVAAMARPGEYVIKKMDELRYTPESPNIVNVISLLSQEEAEVVKGYNRLNNKVTFNHFVFEDFGAPQITDFKKFFRLFDQLKAQGGSIGIHCGAGNGRTGTMLCALLLREKISKSAFKPSQPTPYNKRLSTFDTRFSKGWTLKITKFILKLFWGYDADLYKKMSEAPKICPVVADALAIVKAKAPEAVETTAQLKSLQKLAQHLINNPKACPASHQQPKGLQHTLTKFLTPIKRQDNLKSIMKIGL